MSTNVRMPNCPYVSAIMACAATLLLFAPLVQAEEELTVNADRFSEVLSRSVMSVDRDFLDKYGYQCETVDQINKAGESDYSFIRIASLRLMTKTSGRQSKAALMKGLDDPEVTVRTAAAKLLGTLGDANGVPRLKRDFSQWVERYENGIHDGNKRPSDRRVVWRRRATPVEALGIGLALAKFGDNSAFELAAKVAAKDPTGAWRRLAVHTLAEISRNDRSALMLQKRDPYPVLLSVAQAEKDESVLQIIMGAALLMPRDEGAKILDAVLNSPNAPEAIRRDAMKFREVGDRSDKKP